MSLGLTSLLSPASDHRVVELTGALRAAGHDAHFVDGSWDDRLEAVRSGEAAAAWVCGLLHVGLQEEGGWDLTAVASPRFPRHPEPVYFGDVVVSRTSEVHHFEELRGATFAFNEEASLSGYRMMLDHLAAAATDLSFFGRALRSGSHLASLRLVATGDADCAIIDSTLIDDRVQGTEQVRTLLSVGPYPAPPLVAGPAHHSLLRAAALAAGWAGTDESAYDVLRSVH